MTDQREQEMRQMAGALRDMAEGYIGPAITPDLLRDAADGLDFAYSLLEQEREAHRQTGKEFRRLLTERDRLREEKYEGAVIGQEQADADLAECREEKAELEGLLDRERERYDECKYTAVNQGLELVQLREEKAELLDRERLDRADDLRAADLENARLLKALKRVAAIRNDAWVRGSSGGHKALEAIDIATAAIPKREEDDPALD